MVWWDIFKVFKYAFQKTPPDDKLAGKGIIFGDPQIADLKSDWHGEIRFPNNVFISKGGE